MKYFNYSECGKQNWYIYVFWGADHVSEKIFTEIFRSLNYDLILLFTLFIYFYITIKKIRSFKIFFLFANFIIFDLWRVSKKVKMECYYFGKVPNITKKPNLIHV